MQNHKTMRIFLLLALAGICIDVTLPSASAQQPGGPGQGAPPRHQGRPRGPHPGGPGRRDGNTPPSDSDGGESAAEAPAALRTLPQGVTRLPVVFSGGHDTDPRDGGRPVVLVANALGVTPEIFREAFRHVRPARAGSEPEPAQVQQNKAALMHTLAKYGVDNEHLDAASNYYRYVRSRNELWRTKPAVANALVKNGMILGYEIVRGGAGYSSPPTVSVPTLRTSTATVKLAFGKNLTTNGSIVSITAANSN